ncbi:uncharacterized protein LOC121049355 [Rosa chinensis]|uniref:uncharacterized protein LOC121049355 n=1 Tax=Rosa chinensis TaxID=74649 RepID=UPI001AD94AE5|nr:uncharacterized protein LOC121049355 [Rosa chinensis]
MSNKAWNRDHLFGYCSFATEVWRLAGLSPSLNWNDGYLNVFHELLLSDSFDSKLFEKLITICWQMWKARNDTIFRTVQTNPRSVVAASATVLNSITNPNRQVRRDLTQTQPTTIKWKSPPASCIKLNFDGSMTKTSTAGGFVIWDNQGNPLVAATKNAGSTTVPIVEAIALRDGLLCARDQGYTTIEVERDSKLVIDAVNKCQSTNDSTPLEVAKNYPGYPCYRCLL